MVERYSIASLSIFGSISRDSHDDSSDLDALVRNIEIIGEAV